MAHPMWLYLQGITEAEKLAPPAAINLLTAIIRAVVAQVILADTVATADIVGMALHMFL